MTLPLDDEFASFRVLTNATVDGRTSGFFHYSLLYEEYDVPYTGGLTFRLQSGTGRPGLSICVPNN